MQKVTKLIQKLDDLLLSNGAEAYREPWEELKAEIGKLHMAAQTPVDNTIVQKLTEAVADLVKKQSQPAHPPAPKTYAAALQAGLPPWTGPPPVKEVPTRLSREIVVRNSEATPEDRSRPINQIVENINRTKSAEIKGKVMAARRLPSGDITITADTKETKELLERDKSWLAAVSRTAWVNRRKFPVMVHGMKVASVDCSKQEEAIKEILGQNTHLSSKIEILRVQWPKKALRRGKATTCLIIDVASPEQANTLIDEGLLFHSELKECELYHGDCRITQCYNCQRYGHTARICRNQKKCGICAAPGHDDKACNFREDATRHRCVNCSLNHPAWASSCAERGKQAAKARLAYATRPRRYAGSASSSLFSHPLSGSNSSSQASSSPTDYRSTITVPSTQSPGSQATQARMDGIMTGPARAAGTALGKRGRSVAAGTPGDDPDTTQVRRGRGRPPNRPQASPDDQNIAAFFTQEDEL
jgi:hypothetical protein